MIKKDEQIDNVSILIIEKSDDYIFSYDVSFAYFCPLYKINYVKSEEELVSKLKLDNYNMIISEVFLNGFNWKDVLKYLRNDSLIKNNIIFTSAFDLTDPQIKNLVKSGFTFIEKPFEIKELVDLIELKLFKN